MENLSNLQFINLSIQLEKRLLEHSLTKFFSLQKQSNFTPIKFSFANSQLKKSRRFSAESTIETLLLTDGSLIISTMSVAKKDNYKSFFTFLVLKNDLFLYKKLSI